MDHQAFLVWLNEIDDLSSKQRAETGRLVAGVSSLESVIDLPEANVREGRICPHCASGGAIIRGHASGLTRFFCKGCRKTFNALTGTPLARLRHRDRWAGFAASLRDGETVKASDGRCMVADTTAFRWRHRFPEAVTVGAVRLCGIVEADGTFFPRSRKGDRNLSRKARKRGGKGAVEGLVGYGRRDFMVPIPSFPDRDAFNAHLEEQCRKRQDDVLRGHKASIGERLQADPAAMQDLPGAPFEACELQSGQVTSTSVLRYRGNDYSVPVAYGHRAVWIKGFVIRVVIGCATEVIADHPRSYDSGDMVFDPLHYLPLIERRIMSFDQAAPLQGWELPDAFATLRRLLEARQGKAGKREYVQVLRLSERFELEVLHLAVKDALRMGAVSFDAIKHLVLCRVERRPPRLDLDVYPFLPGTNIATTSASSCMSLLSGGDA